MSVYVGMYVGICQHGRYMSAYVGFCRIVGFCRHGRHMSAFVGICRLLSAYVGFGRHMSAFVGICRLFGRHMSACRLLSAYVGFCRLQMCSMFVSSCKWVFGCIMIHEWDTSLQFSSKWLKLSEDVWKTTEKFVFCQFLKNFLWKGHLHSKIRSNTTVRNMVYPLPSQGFPRGGGD